MSGSKIKNGLLVEMMVVRFDLKIRQGEANN